MMKPKFNFILLLISLFFLGQPTLSYSQVWPGDVNNNGIVNHVDLIFLGEAYFNAGPPRPFPEQGIFWEEKTIDSPWGITFPGTTTDLVFADCDGDGLISFEDANAIHFNYGLTHGVVTPDVFPPGVPGENPSLSFDISLVPEPLLEMGVLIIPVVLGTEDNQVEDFFSIGFSINYDEEIFQAESMNFFFVDGSWINPGGNELLEITNNNTEEGILTVAASRSFVNSPVSGAGPIGILTIIIEDDVVGLMEPSIETSLQIDQILLSSPGLGTQPVVGDTTTLEILPNDIILSDESPEEQIDLTIFPNPLANELNLKLDGEAQMEGIYLFNTIGQKVLGTTFSPRQELQYDIQNLPTGIYFLQIQLADGTVVSRRVVVEK